MFLPAVIDLDADKNGTVNFSKCDLTFSWSVVSNFQALDNKLTSVGIVEFFGI